MNIYEVTYKDESSRVRDKIPDSQWVDDYRLIYQRKQKYVDCEGKLGFVVIDEVETITKRVKAVSEEAVRKLFNDREVDYHGQTKRINYDLEVKLIQELDVSPFEKLNPDYCEVGTGSKITREDVGESVIIMENQSGYDKMSSEEKYAYLNDNVYAEDTHTYLPI